MLRALIYLRLTSFKNWTWSRLRRLRQPKYLAGGIVGFAYFYFFFFRGLAGPPARRLPPHAPAEALRTADAMLAIDWLPFASAMGAIALFVLLVLMWVIPARPAALGFTEAEIAFLFPAPVTRRALVHFRLLSSQFRNLIGAGVMMLFSNRWSFVEGNPLTHALGWWFVFSALNLHFSGANFTLTRLAERGIGTWRRRVLIVALFATIAALTIWQLPASGRLPEFTDEFALSAIADWVVTLAGTAPLGWVVWPLKLIIAPFLAADTRTFLTVFAPALAVITLHYLWVVQTAVSFEDATIDQAQKRAARVAAWRAGDRRIGNAASKGRPAPFKLAAVGRPEIAFLWKNLLSTWPYFTPRVFVGCTLVIIAGCSWMNTQPAWRGLLPGIGVFALIFSGYTLLVGPQFARQDMRTDLPNADILKTYPLAGWQVVLGQLLAPTAILTAILWLAILVLALTFHPLRPGLVWLTLQLRVATALGLAVLVPVLVALQLLVPNAATLLFPGWFQASRGRGGGVEVVGQRMIFFFAQLLTMTAALLPPTLFGALLIFILQWLVGPVAAVTIAAVAVLLILLAEVWLGLWWLGGRFEKLDLSSELRA
ncbi:MAG: hypothetical protein Q7S40_15940 [Opitutaceae bacterium]|nr:hypothetical protein [Opitutaceae bacterium]